MNAAPSRPSLIGRVARAFTWAALAYWGAQALLAPVVTVDSQMYNLARLELALRGGLFGNDYFTSIYQVIFPWSFDAVHLPFLLAGWGYALPSFACLAGTAYVVFTLMRGRLGEDAAWVALVGLLSLPCLVYQASSTKNDLALLFTGAVWAYARWRRQREGRDVHLVWMVLALGFMTGVKSPGVVYGGVLGLWTLRELRSRRPLLARVAAGLAAAVLLFGSVETYVESARLYGHPLGPPALVHRMRNSDGLRGCLANLTRYAVGSVYVGPTNFSDGQTAVNRLVAAERTLLRWTGLTDAGTEIRFRDRTLFFTQSGLEELSGYGPTGTLAMATLLVAVVFWRPRSLWWRVAAPGFLGLAIVGGTVAYTCWTNRYLVSWYSLGTIALVCVLWESSHRWSRWLRWGFLVLAMAGTVAAPLLSFNRRPADLVAAVRDREHLETSAYPLAGRLRESLRRLHAASPLSRVFLVVEDDSPVLPLIEDRALGVVLVRQPVLRRLLDERRLNPGDLVATGNRTLLPELQLVETVTATNVYSVGLPVQEYILKLPAQSATTTPH